MNKRTLNMAAVLVLMLSSACAAEVLSDPYLILEKHFESIGGFENVRAESTLYVEATLSAFGLDGSMVIWTRPPVQQRQEIDLKMFKETTGDNGEYAWTADVNGKVQIHKDENSLTRRELRKLVGLFDYLDRNSSSFSLSYSGIDKAADIDCHVIKMTNSLNQDYTLFYIDTSRFYKIKEVEVQPDRETETLFFDYREDNGLVRSFRQDVTFSPGQQKMTIQVTKYEGNLKIDPALFEPPSEAVRDFRFLAGDRAENIPFEYILDHIFVRVNLAGKERLWILDTGASISIIDSAFASELELESAGEIKADAVANIVSINFVSLPPFSIKGIEFDAQQVGSLNINRILRRAGIESAGILGYDFISRFVLKIDYANKTLSLYDPETFEYDGPGVVIEAPMWDNIMSVPITVDGKYTGKWDIDIGAGGCAFFYPFARENGFLDRHGVESIAFGAGGGRKERGVKFETLELAGFVIKEPLISFPTESVEGGFGATERIGNLGNSALRHFTVYFDYNRQQLIVEKGGDFDRKFPRGKSGFQIMYNDDNRLEVLFVSENTPADRAGFREGDLVLAVNDINVDYIAGLEAIRNIMRAEVGTVLNIAVMRDGERKDLKLTLEELY